MFFAHNAKYKFEHKGNAKINSMFGQLNLIEKTYSFMQNYIFLETIFTSYEPTLSGFDDSGNPVFIEEQRSKHHIHDVRDMHTAITDYIVNSRIELCDIQEVDKVVPDFLLKLLYSQYSRINTDYFDSAVLTDEFNKITYGFSYIIN